MKYSIVFLFLLVSCELQYQDKNIVESEIISIDSTNQLIDIPLKDAFLLHQIVFGRFCGECSGNCAPMFRLNLCGNVSTLWADYNNNYFKGESYLKFDTDLNKKEKLAIAYDIMYRLPKILRAWKSDIKRFGCPDCTDGCGIYIEIGNTDSDRPTKKFALDLYPTERDSVPKEITEYAKYINTKINELMR